MGGGKAGKSYLCVFSLVDSLRMVKKYGYILFLALISFWISGCSDTLDKKNELSVYVCDAPAEAFQEVTLEVLQVELRQASGSEWTTVTVEDGYLELLRLVNGEMQRVALEVVNSGASFDAIRFTFNTENAAVVTGGQNLPLAFDGADAVVTVEVPAFVMDETNRALLFDIDAAASVVDDAAAENGLRMKPSVFFVDPQAVGSVQGSLMKGSVSVNYQMLLKFTQQDTGQVFSTYCTNDQTSQGVFFMRLPPGSYKMQAIPREEDVDFESYEATFDITAQKLLDLGLIELLPQSTT